jgi:hypothetical protein
VANNITLKVSGTQYISVISKEDHHYSVKYVCDRRVMEAMKCYNFLFITIGE